MRQKSPGHLCPWACHGLSLQPFWFARDARANLRLVHVGKDLAAQSHFPGRPARVYAGWALSQAFYRKRVWAEHGYESLEDFLVRDWEQRFVRRDPRDHLLMIETWLHSDISNNDRYDGDLTRALGAITAPIMVMPASSALYFTVEDSRRETALMPHAELRVIESIWSHRAGNPWQCPHDEAVIRVVLQKLLSNDGA